MRGSENNLDMVILSNLIEWESSGWDITKNVNGFWQTSHQHVYRRLVAMEKLGFVSFTVEKSEHGAPDRKVYSITDSGLDYARFLVSGEIKRPKILNQNLVAKVSLGLSLAKRGESISNLCGAVAEYFEALEGSHVYSAGEDLEILGQYEDFILCAEKSAAEKFLGYLDEIEK